MPTSPPPFLHHFEFHSPDPDGGSFVVSESLTPDRVTLSTTLAVVTITERQFRALTRLIGYGENTINFLEEPTQAQEEPTQ